MPNLNTELTTTLVMPAYNSVGYIQTALDSALEQTHPPNELIVVDDGSQDGTAEFLQRRYGERVQVIRQSNAGPAAARNNGVRHAQGNWIAFLDADDSWLPEKLERQAALIADGVGIVHCFNEGDQPHHRPDEPEITFEVMWRKNYIGTSTAMVRKQAFEQVQGFQEDRRFIGAEDYNLWLRIIGSGYRVATLREPLARYTPTAHSLMSQVLRVVQGESLNIQHIAEHFQLSREMVVQKQVAIWQEYGETLLWLRDKREARKLYAQVLKAQPSSRAMLNYLATFVPTSLLNMKRRLSALAAG